jgi:hypothetical protein
VGVAGPGAVERRRQECLRLFATAIERGPSLLMAPDTVVMRRSSRRG